MCSGLGYTKTKRPVIPKKGGFGVMAITLQILSNGNRENQTMSKIRKTVPKLSQNIKRGMIMIVHVHFLRFAKRKKVICVHFSIIRDNVI